MAVTEKIMNKWHKDLAYVVGALSLSIVKRSSRYSVLMQWATVLERVALEMRTSLK